jgi:hypothetical protein
MSDESDVKDKILPSKKATIKKRLPTITVKDTTPKQSVDQKIYEDDENFFIIQTEEVDTLGRHVKRNLVILNNKDYGDEHVLTVNHDNYLVLRRLFNKT